MDDKVKMAISSVSKVVNILAAKKLALFVGITLVFVRGIQYFDSDPCNRLLNSGTLVDGKQWQPHGCMIHLYKKSESQQCLKNKQIAFVGDSRMREHFYYFIDQVTDSKFLKPKKAHSNIVFDTDQLNLSFYWIPEVNESAFELYEKWQKENNRPDVIIQSAATHSIKRSNGSAQVQDEYRKNLTRLQQFMSQLTGLNTKIYWMLQEPVIEEKLHVARRAITNLQITTYNSLALSVFEHQNGQAKFSGISVLKSTRDVALQTTSTLYDGLHLGEKTEKHVTQILLNLFCNNVILLEFGVCCQHLPSITFPQIVVLVVGLLCISTSIIFKVTGIGTVPKKNVESKETSKPTSLTNFKELIDAAANLSLILFYFFVCDRTNIFMRSNKHYAPMRFFIPFMYVLFIGMFAIEQSQSSNILSRDQTDEWKGWMQLVILIYHFTGSSANIPIYMHVRLLVAMYLFMTGYGHFSYFWNRGDFSFRRVLNVLFRLNFLTVMLCIIMNRPYQFYYFVPLCTFWFLVLYVAMCVWPRVYISKTNTSGVANPQCVAQYPVVTMCFKLFMLLVFIVVLFVSKTLFMKLFSWWPFSELFQLSGSVREWWFRCQLDRFAMFHGVIFCFIYLICKRFSILEDSKQGCLMSTRASLILVTSAIVVVIAYMLWAVQCTDKVSCNFVHSYASFLPITAFIIIRNVPGYLRTNYSSFFAWFGRISLELFIGQYHIWLAADTKGVLVLGPPGWPTANLLLTTFLFVCVAHEINQLTGIFAKHFLGSASDGDRPVVFRFLIVIVVLLFVYVFNFPITN